MNPTLTWLLASAVLFSLASISPALAQTAIGGVKPQQNKIGGAAKPPTVVGGAPIRTPTSPASPKPGPALSMTKPASPRASGIATPGPTANNLRVNPPGTTPSNKGGKAASLKCAAGACVGRGPKQ